VGPAESLLRAHLPRDGLFPISKSDRASCDNYALSRSRRTAGEQVRSRRPPHAPARLLQCRPPPGRRQAGPARPATAQCVDVLRGRRARCGARQLSLLTRGSWEAQVIGSEEEDSRRLLCEATAIVMRACLRLLGIQPLYRI